MDTQSLPGPTKKVFKISTLLNWWVQIQLKYLLRMSMTLSTIKDAIDCLSRFWNQQSQQYWKYSSGLIDEWMKTHDCWVKSWIPIISNKNFKGNYFGVKNPINTIQIRPTKQYQNHHESFRMGSLWVKEYQKWTNKQQTIVSFHARILGNIVANAVFYTHGMTDVISHVGILALWYWFQHSIDITNPQVILL